MSSSSSAFSNPLEVTNISFDYRTGEGEEEEEEDTTSSAFDSESELAELQDNLKHLSLRKKTSYRKAISNRHTSHTTTHSKHTEVKRREIRSSIDWTENAIFGDHIWINTNASGDFCYLFENNDCTKTGPRRRCAGCRIVSHINCIPALEKYSIRCKPTFYEASAKNYKEQNTIMHHHWMHRRREEGKCQKCGKEVIAISCSWCKIAYHTQCFPPAQPRLVEECTLGPLADIIVPPYWIIKLAKKGSFKSSVRKRRKSSFKKREGKEEHGRTFVIKPIASSPVKPVIVFINPRSGGNQGAELLHKFQSLLNPRQVFDLNVCGPRYGLEFYKKVVNLRILACGGDGTVGWILSHIDNLGITPHPAVAVLPLGTGNDLARTLNWGGSYSDEHLSKVLIAVEEGPVVQLDRWNIEVTCNPTLDAQQTLEDGGVPNLPLDVMNNYFSLGADARVTLEFHESREANPAKFCSRFRNKMFYAGVGGKDVLRRSWRDLSEHIQLECDNQDLTSKIKETKFHCLLFLNIPKYAAGTTPWGNPSQTSFEPQRLDDGSIEVIGFTAASLAGLQIGAHGGMRLTQCKSVRLVTTKTIPMQVDGEPCRLQPSIIRIHLRNQANMIQRSKRSNNTPSPLNDHISQHSITEQLHLRVHWLRLTDYESLHYDKADLYHASKSLGVIVIDGDSTLDHIRAQIERLKLEALASGMVACPSSNWCFLDSITANHFFQISNIQEPFHYAVDIASDIVYILDLEGCSQNGQSPASDASLASVTSLHSIDNTADVNRTGETANVKGMRGKSAMFMDACWQGFVDKRICPMITSKDPLSVDLVAEIFKEVTEAHQLGVDLLTVDKSGMTGLHYAVVNNNKEVVTYLIEKAPSVILDMTDHEKGQTALHKAAWLQMRSICCMLVSAGASLTVTDSQGNTPSRLAFMANDQELGAYLQYEQYSRPLTSCKVHETAI